MSDAGYKIRDQSAIHFVTFAVVGWVDVFTRQDYRDTVVQSLKYCQEENGLVIPFRIIKQSKTFWYNAPPWRNTVV